jgi:hypothetical protein
MNVKPLYNQGPKDLKVGERVAYARHWLKSCGFVTGDIPFARGVVTAIRELNGVPKLVSVAWDNSELGPAMVLISNLVRVSEMHKELV